MSPPPPRALLHEKWDRAGPNQPGQVRVCVLGHGGSVGAPGFLAAAKSRHLAQSQAQTAGFPRPEGPAPGRPGEASARR